MTSGARDALLRVANSFLEQDRPLHAIKCLEAICMSKKTEFPEMEAEVLIKLAKVLLEFTHDVKKAIQHLQKAPQPNAMKLKIKDCIQHVVLRRIREAFSLKCAVLSALADCYQAEEDNKQLREVCTKGVEACKKGAKTRESEELRGWHVHFLTTLAAFPPPPKDPSKAVRYLHEALKLVPDDPETQMVLHLGIVQLHLNVPDLEATKQALPQAEKGLQELSKCPKALQANLRLHYRLLWVCYHLALGDMETLLKSRDGKKGSPPVFVEEVKSLSEAAKSSGEAYQWLPNGVLPALAYVAAAAIWRPVGKFAPGKELLTTALDFLRAAERAAGLDMFHKIGEEELAPQQRVKMLHIAGVEVLATETLAIIALTKTELQEGGGHIIKLMEVGRQFPSLASRLTPSIHLLAGHYCCKTGHPEEATAHFVAASRTAKRRATKQVATWEAALCLIEDGGEGGLVRAIEMLKQEGIYDKPADSTGHIASALHEYVSGRLITAQGEGKKGSVDMMRALKIAHAPLKNHQLVANIMVALLPSMASDQNAMETMINTTIHLSKSLYDLPTQIEGNQQMLEWLITNGKDREVGKQREYIARKQTLLQEASQRALDDTEQHARLLTWFPPGKQT